MNWKQWDSCFQFLVIFHPNLNSYNNPSKLLFSNLSHPNNHLNFERAWLCRCDCVQSNHNSHKQALNNQLAHNNQRDRVSPLRLSHPFHHKLHIEQLFCALSFIWLGKVAVFYNCYVDHSILCVLCEFIQLGNVEKRSWMRWGGEGGDLL